ncbi:AMP-binding protein [uncultured Maribacter sp.]|uniref:AMP-binding protein n=1 Tax=uncultured Maribacter sp. TaxID=431308 RepID=UPI0026217671|nr:AMP-binding protein [uncultured Maribacter sp.]
MVNNELFSDWLQHFADNDGERLATVDIHTGRHLTYSELNDRAKRLASGLKNRFTIEKNNRIAIIANNSSDIIELMFACWKLGAVFMPMNWRLSAFEIAEIFKEAEPSVVIYDSEFLELLQHTKLPSLERQENLATSPYEQLITESPASITMPAVSLDDMNSLMYTSGTTGEPKGVIGTYRMTQTNVLQQASIINSDSVCLTYAPLFHTAGLNGFTTPLFHFGGTLYIMRGWDADIAIKYLSSEKIGVTHTLGVPYHLTVLSQHPDFESTTFPALQVIGVGGAPANLKLIERWYEKGVALSQSYGMTEIFGLIFQPPEAARKNPKAAGKALMYTDVQIGDDNGNPVASGQTGEIQVKSSGLTPGYWNKPKLTEASFVNGWFRTGDAGYVDSDGMFYIVDRIKDMYISGGENVYPIEIENVISKIPEVAMVAVIGVPDEQWQEVGKACVLLRQGTKLTEEAVLDVCRKKLAKYKVPKSVEFLSSFPISGQGKILKRELRKKYEE